MFKQKLAIIILGLSLILPNVALALEMPKSLNDIVDLSGLSAKSYLVIDKTTGETIFSKNPDLLWTPASLTKLVTALVVMDTKPNLNKIVAITQADQTAGGCSAGGACINTKPGVKYRMKDLFYASLVASANNATAAVARSTGLPKEKFVERMNKKVKDLGAVQTVFYEPTGMEPKNMTTASDYAKIVKVAFANSQIHTIATTQNYNFGATNNKKYYHRLKNTNKLLTDGDLVMVGGKTGYLEESLYNFVTEVKDKLGNDMIIVVFGSQSSASQFKETKQLFSLAGLARTFAGLFPAVLGTSDIKKIN